MNLPVRGSNILDKYVRISSFGYDYITVFKNSRFRDMEPLELFDSLLESMTNDVRYLTCNWKLAINFKAMSRKICYHMIVPTQLPRTEELTYLPGKEYPITSYFVSGEDSKVCDIISILLKDNTIVYPVTDGLLFHVDNPVQLIRNFLRNDFQRVFPYISWNEKYVLLIRRDNVVPTEYFDTLNCTSGLSDELQRFWQVQSTCDVGYCLSRVVQ